MKIGILTVSAVALGASMALANPLENGLVSELQSQGYDYIEVKNAPGQIKIEAIRGTEELEMIFDRQSGALLKREVNRADARDIGRVGVDFDTRDRNFIDSDDSRSSQSSSSYDDDDDDDDDRSGRDRDRGRDRSDDDDDDDDDRSGRGRGRGRGGDDD